MDLDNHTGDANAVQNTDFHGGNCDRQCRVLEWRLKQPEAAMRVVQTALDLVGTEPDLEKRRLRLRRRLDRARDPDRRSPKDRNEPLPFPDEPGERLEDVGVVDLAGVLPEPVDGLERA